MLNDLAWAAAYQAAKIGRNGATLTQTIALYATLAATIAASIWYMAHGRRP